MRQRLASQVYRPVHWVDTIRTMLTRGATSVIECGPGKVLTGLAAGYPDMGESAIKANFKRWEQLLDELILELRDALGTTIVVVTHELASILSIGSNSVYLDAETHTMIATGDPQQAARSGDARVRHFLSRGEL